MYLYWNSNKMNLFLEDLYLIVIAFILNNAQLQINNPRGGLSQTKSLPEPSRYQVFFDRRRG